MLSLVTAGAPEGGLSGGCQGAILSSRRRVSDNDVLWQLRPDLTDLKIRLDIYSRLG